MDQVFPWIVLIGMMGAGKSSVGRCLHRRTGLSLLDVDKLVASNFGLSIPKIFAEYGEKKFRDAETEVLRHLPNREQAIIVTGGGVVLREENVGILKSHGVIVWLDGDEETLFCRASRNRNRPLLRTKNPRRTFSEILCDRRPVYENVADIRVDISALTNEEVTVAILTKFGRISRPRIVRPA